MSRKISRREERARRKAQERVRNRLMIGGGAAAVALIFGFAVYGQLSRPAPTPTPTRGITTPEPGTTSEPGLIPAEPFETEQFFPEEGIEHIEPGSPPPYEHTSDPPTSGWHYPQPAAAGVYEQPVEYGYLVHSMEHGYVIIWYNCAFLSEEACSDLKAKLIDLFNRKAPGGGFSAWKLIIVPRPELDTVIALTAWTWLDKFNEYDEQRISDFIDRHRNQGPEATPN